MLHVTAADLSSQTPIGMAGKGAKMSGNQAQAVTSIAPAAGDCVGHADQAGGEEHAGPVLVGDEGGEAEADEEADDDEGGGILHRRHGSHKAGRDAQEEGKACTCARLSKLH